MPNTRKLDPATSHQAERSVTGLAESYLIITELLRAAPMNDEQLIRAWRTKSKKLASESGIRSRRAELVAVGVVQDTGKRIKMASGRSSIVWGLA